MIRPKIQIKILLLYYATALSTALIIGGFVLARTAGDVVSNIFFLPVAIFLWITVKERWTASIHTENKGSNSAKHNKEDKQKSNYEYH